MAVRDDSHAQSALPPMRRIRRANPWEGSDIIFWTPERALLAQTPFRMTRPAQLAPALKVGNLIVEVRSATAGVGSFTFKFDHMAELTCRAADQIIAAKKAAAAAA